MVMLTTSMITLSSPLQRPFDLWLTEVSTPQELQSLVQHPGGLQTDCIIRQPNIWHALPPLRFSAVLLHFSPASLLLHLQTVDEHTDWPSLAVRTTAEAARGFTHLLVRPSLVAEYGIKVWDATIQIHPAGTTYLSDLHKPANAFTPASGDQLIAAVEKQRSGEGLRSLYPYAYVWYHDLLYVITKISIPGFAASRACNPQVLTALMVLQEKGYLPKSVEALYPRPFLSSIYQTTAKHTWYGIRLAQNYCQYRHELQRLPDVG